MSDPSYRNTQWLCGRAPYFRLKEPWFESCVAVWNFGQVVFTLDCYSSRNSMNEYLAIDNGGYLYEHPSRINCTLA